ncbi:MAG: type II and III secretion system protein family protein [Thermoguttaceae bacterium]
MNQRFTSVARRSITIALLLLGQLAADSLVAWGQAPVVIPPGPATPIPAPGQGTDSNSASLYYNVKGSDDHLKMVVNTSRFLTLDKKIPQVQVNNPDILDVMPISPNQVQISAKRTGVTQVNLWGDDKRIYTVNVIVMGDAAELSEILRQLFPRSSLTIVPVNGNSVILSGYVDQPESVPKIVSVAGKYFPDVINNMRVSGVQMGMLHVKVYEVSRTKLRNMGFDWANISNDGSHIVFSGVSGLLQTAAGGGAAGVFGPPSNAPDNAFKVQGGSFYAVLSALRQDSLAKLDAEPDLVAISGRPAYMLVGGEIGYQVSSTVAGNTVGWKEYGTRLDFVPIMLGNGRMHIDVRASVSALDASNGVDGVPALTKRETETGVELRAGQTLAIAGLLQHTVEASNGGLPWISEIPYLGAAFRSVSHSTNEIELIVLITPEIVDGMDPGQVPACMPGMETTNPSDWELFYKGHLEVPNCCPVEPAVSRISTTGGANSGFNPGEVPTNRQSPQNPPAANQVTMNPQPAEPGFIGPIGYDVLK